MPNKRFLLIYADRSRAHINIEERDSLLIAKRIRKLNEFSYEYLETQHISKSFTNLGELRDRYEPLKPCKRYLEGSWIFELNDKRTRELMETPEGLQIRLATA